MAIGTLGIGMNLTPSEYVSASGYFSNVLDAGPYFTATSLVNEGAAPVLLFVRNRPGLGLDVSASASGAQIQLTLSGAAANGERAVLDHGLLGVIPLPTAPAPTVVHPTGPGSYSLRDRTNGGVRSFTDFQAFTNALQADLVRGAALVQLGAVGDYIAVNNKLIASSTTVVIE